MVIHKVLKQVQEMNNLVTPKRRSNRREEIALEILRIPIKPLVIKRGKWLSWEKPGDCSLKLNTDGSVIRERRRGDGQ